MGVTNGWSDCGIPTKPVGGLQSDIGKVAPALGWVGALYWTAQKLFNVSPWAPALRLQASSGRGHYPHLTVGVEPTPRG